MENYRLKLKRAAEEAKGCEPRPLSYLDVKNRESLARWQEKRALWHAKKQGAQS